MKPFVFFNLLSLCLSIYSAHSNPLSTQEAKEFVGELTRELAPQVKETLRPIKVYHYGQRGNLRRDNLSQTATIMNWGFLNLARLGNGITDLKDPKANSNPVELNPPEITSYFKEKAGLIFGSGTSDGAAGPGLYAAIDPIQSESYAGKPWFMLEIEVPAKTKYLPYANGFLVSDSFFKKWFVGFEWESAYEANKASYVKYGNKVMISKEAMIDFPKYKTLWRQAIQELNIEMMSYFWGKYGTRHCQFKNVMGPSAELAFVFVNPDLLNDKNVKLNVYVPELETSPSTEKTAHYRNILDLVELGSIRIYGSHDLGKPVPDSLFNLAYASNNYSNIPRGSFSFTYQWNAALGRKSPIIPGLMNEAEALELSDLINKYNFADPQNIPEGTISFNPSVFSKSANGNSTSNNSNPYVYVTFTAYLDSLVKINSGVAELNRRYKILESQTFGCSPDHPEENLYEFFMGQ